MLPGGGEIDRVVVRAWIQMGIPKTAAQRQRMARGRGEGEKKDGGNQWTSKAKIVRMVKAPLQKIK